jgi:hypothetical protein
MANSQIDHFAADPPNCYLRVSTTIPVKARQATLSLTVIPGKVLL